MIIEIKDEQFEMFDSGLWKILQDKGLDITIKKEQKHWEVKDGKGNTFQLLKGTEVYKYFEIKKDDILLKQVISPTYTIINTEDKKLTLILRRTQDNAGSTDQKLPYGDFMFKEHVKIFQQKTENFEYDVDIAITLNGWFTKTRYEDLREYLTDNGIKLWVNKIKLN